MSTSPDGGHLFIVNADLTKIACDALLIPTDGYVDITEAWEPFLRKRKRPACLKVDEVYKLTSSAPAEPRIWLGNVGQLQDDSEFSVFEPVICNFIERATADLMDATDEVRLYPWSKRRLAVNVIGSGEGGGRLTKGQLIEGLISTLSEQANKNNVDIILATFGDKQYSAAQRARRAVVDHANLGCTWRFDESTSTRLVRHAQRLAHSAITRDLVLFVGAGASAGAGLPTWQKLLKAVAKDEGIESLDQFGRNDLRDQATILERRMRKSERNLKELVAEKLSGTDCYALLHGLLSSLPSNEAVTTNFDEMFEASARTAGRRLAVLPENPQDADGHWLLKLHGSVTPADSMILTRSDYLDMPRRYGALMGLVQGMLLMRHMLFVGYSLRDEDFHELIHEVRSAWAGSPSAARGTMLTLFDDEHERELWADDLEVVPIVGYRESPEALPGAARQLEVFLDLVGFLAATSAPYFLDLTYSSLSDDEAGLRTTLLQLRDDTAKDKEGSVGFIVNRFLEQLG